MKSVKTVIAAAMFSLVGLFCSCGSDDEPTPEPTLSISPESIEFTSEAESDQFTIESNTSWNVSCNRSWCTLNAASGQGNRTIVVEVDENKDLESRTCRITVTTADGAMSRNITVTQKGGKASLSVSPADVELASSKDATASVTLTTQASWTISGVPEWLSVPKSGMGNTSLNLMAISENDTDEARVANLQITAETTSTNLKVTQLPARIKCYVEPKDMVILYNEIAFEPKATSNVNSFQYVVVNQDDIDYYGEKAIEDALVELNAKDPLKISVGYTCFPWVEIDKQQYLYMIAFDANNNKGAMKKYAFKSKEDEDMDKAAWVSFGDECYYGNDGFQIDCVKEAYCDSYHLIMGNVPTYKMYEHPAFYAFQINYFLKYKKLHAHSEDFNFEIITNYPNSHVFIHPTSTLATDPVIVAYAWGMKKDGELSTFLMGTEQDISASSETSKKFKRSPSKQRSKGIVLCEYNPITKQITERPRPF